MRKNEHENDKLGIEGLLFLLYTFYFLSSWRKIYSLKSIIYENHIFQDPNNG
jgi:hypothetical protein